MLVTVELRWEGTNKGPELPATRLTARRTADLESSLHSFP